MRRWLLLFRGVGERTGLPGVVWERLTRKGTFERRPHSEPAPSFSPACPASVVPPVSDSPSCSLLHHSAPGTLAFLLFLKPARLVPTSEPFRFPSLPPGILFLQIFTWLASSPHSGLCSSVRSPGRRSPATRTPFCPGPPAVRPSTHGDAAFLSLVGLVLSLTRKLREDRNFVVLTTLSLTFMTVVLTTCF